MRVLITGASGLVGRALGAKLRARGDDVVPAVRRADAEGVRWDVERGFEPPDALSGFDAVVHLAGENVGGGRWTAARKRRILDSRVHGTRSVVAALEAARPRPRVLVSASAIGLYGDDAGDDIKTEDSPRGEGFLADVVDAWEREALAAEALGVRLVRARIGVVLSPDGGALASLLPLFRWGVGGRVGSGRQWMSWIHIDDLVAAMLSLLDDEHARGPINLTAPQPATNTELSHALGAVLHRPSFLPAPAFAVRLALGEMSVIALGGQRVLPAALEARGFEFAHPALDEALADLLGE